MAAKSIRLDHRWVRALCPWEKPSCYRWEKWLLPYGQSCVFRIELPGAVTLIFTELDTELNFDFVKVYDTGEPTRLLGSFSGFYNTSKIPPLQATSGNMTITFSSDSSIAAAGWTAYYQLDSMAHIATNPPTYTWTGVPTFAAFQTINPTTSLEPTRDGLVPDRTVQSPHNLERPTVLPSWIRAQTNPPEGEYCSGLRVLTAPSAQVKQIPYRSNRCVNSHILLQGHSLASTEVTNV